MEIGKSMKGKYQIMVNAQYKSKLYARLSLCVFSVKKYIFESDVVTPNYAFCCYLIYKTLIRRNY